MSDKQSKSFEAMYGKLEKTGVPEKISGRPVSRSAREFLAKLKEQNGQS
jgi:ABC-type histidine transport system ATPase subunit